MPRRESKVLLGPITRDDDCERYARILQPGYERAHWTWATSPGKRNAVPSDERICETIKILLGDVVKGEEFVSTGGLTVMWEDDSPVLYAHVDLAPQSGGVAPGAAPDPRLYTSS